MFVEIHLLNTSLQLRCRSRIRICKKFTQNTNSTKNNALNIVRVPRARPITCNRAQQLKISWCLSPWMPVVECVACGVTRVSVGIGHTHTIHTNLGGEQRITSVFVNSMNSKDLSCAQLKALQRARARAQSVSNSKLFVEWARILRLSAGFLLMLLLITNSWQITLRRGEQMRDRG